MITTVPDAPLNHENPKDMKRGEPREILEPRTAGNNTENRLNAIPAKPNTVEIAVTDRGDRTCDIFVPALRVGTHVWDVLLCVRTIPRLDMGQNDAERRRRHSHAERGNEINSLAIPNLSLIQR